MRTFLFLVVGCFVPFPLASAQEPLRRVELAPLEKYEYKVVKPPEHQLVLSLDPLLDLPATWELTPGELAILFEGEGFSENPYFHWLDEDVIAVFLRRPYANVGVKLTLLGGAVPVHQACVSFDPDALAGSGLARRLDIHVEGKGIAAAARLREKFGALFASEPEPGPRAPLGWKADRGSRSEIWSGSSGGAVLWFSETNCAFSLLAPGEDARPSVGRWI